jgi:hypothetical protein
MAGTEEVTGDTDFLVPKLCLGTHDCEALLRGSLRFSLRSREAELRAEAFPSRAWEREN